MLIGIDASPLNRPQRTGTEWYTYHLILNLAKIDPFNQYLLYSPHPLGDEFKILPANFKNKVLGWTPNRLWTQIRLSWEMLRRPPDVLFVPARALPVICPKKTITTIHDIGFERYPQYYKKFARWYLRFSTKFALKRAAKIITVSEFTKKELLDVYQEANGNKIEVVYNGYHPIYRKIKPTEISQKFLAKAKIKKPFILSIGRLEKKKNTLGIISAFANLYHDPQIAKLNLQLVLVGKAGLGWQEIEEEIKNKKMSEKIITTGWLNDRVVAGLMREASIFVFPSFYEGFGLPIIEAMASGVPVVTSNAASCPEVAQDAALIVDPLNFQEIAESIKQILLDNNLKENLIKNGMSRVKTFDWQKCASQTLKILASL